MLQLNCNVLTMMQYIHCLHNVHNQSTAICRQIICVDIEVEYFCDNIIYHYPTSVCMFCKCNARNLVWNWYGSMEDCLPFHFRNLPFHSILASSIFHTEISVPFHSIFHSIPCPGKNTSHFPRRLNEDFEALSAPEIFIGSATSWRDEKIITKAKFCWKLLINTIELFAEKKADSIENHLLFRLIKRY